MSVTPYPVMLFYPYRGRPLPVGKVTCVHGVWTCYHEQSGTQDHHVLDAPGGVDLTVARWCLQTGVRQWAHYDPKEQQTYIVRLETLLRKGIEKTWDGRRRLFLPRAQWDRTVPGTLKTPWVTREQIIDENDLDPETPLPPLESPPAQGKLW